MKLHNKLPSIDDDNVDDGFLDEREGGSWTGADLPGSSDHLRNHRDRSPSTDVLIGSCASSDKLCSFVREVDNLNSVPAAPSALLLAHPTISLNSVCISFQRLEGGLSGDVG